MQDGSAVAACTPVGHLPCGPLVAEKEQATASSSGGAREHRGTGSPTGVSRRDDRPLPQRSLCAPSAPLACVFEVLQVALLGFTPAIAALVAALAVATVVLLRAEDASPLICATSAALSAFAAIIFAYIFALAIAVPAVTSLKELATVMVGVLLLKGRAQSWTRFAAQSLMFVGAVSSWGPFWGAYLLLPPRMVDVSYECNRLSKWGARKRTVLRTSLTPLLRRLALLQMSQQWGPMRVIMHVAMHVLDLALSYVMVAVWGFLSPVAIWVLPKPSPRSVWEFAFHVRPRLGERGCVRRNA